MAVQNSMYLRGFEAGKIAGRQLGLKDAETVMRNDLTFSYGTLAITLTEDYGWEQEEIEKLIVKIQDKWGELDKDRHLNAEGKLERMAEMVERRTGIQLVQAVENILRM